MPKSTETLKIVAALTIAFKTHKISISSKRGNAILRQKLHRKLKRRDLP